MMTRLRPVIPIHPDETHRSWAARLAAFHIGAPVSDLFADMNIDPLAYALGAPDEVARLAVIAGVSSSDLHRSTLTRVTHRVHHLGKEALINVIHPDKDLRYCTVCLREDAEAAALNGQHAAFHLRERLAWRFRSVRFCPRHGIALDSIDRPDEEELVGALPTQLIAPSDAPGANALTNSIQAYIAGRLTGVTGPQWLDDQPLGQVIRSAELLGTALAFEPHDAFEDLTDTEREAATQCGWKFVSQGDRKLRQALRILEARAAVPRGTGKWSKRRVFGNLLREAQESTLRVPLWDVLHDHIAEMVA